MKRRFLKLAVILSFCELTASLSFAQVRVLVDQVGYETSAPKVALIESTTDAAPSGFALVDDATGDTVFTGKIEPAGTVDHWIPWHFWKADFSSWHTPGEYRLRTAGGEPVASSCAFEIGDNLLERRTLSNVLYYFKGQRSSGDFDRADRHLAIPGEPGHFVDVHGGWYDATGDYGIHLSHQNPTSYFNPQQVPLVAWTLLASYEVLEGRGDDNFSEYERRLLDEGLYGADFLVRMKRPKGSFYESISAPGPGKLARDRVIGNPNWRTQIKTSASGSTERAGPATGPHAYEAGFRAGGGMAIAALALASTMPEDGNFPRAQYLATAEAAFAFLDAHNAELLNDHTENILDDYCALMAATELYRSTHLPSYRTAADRRADRLMARLTSSSGFHNYWRADDGTRPFFHPSDAGLPVISLIRYATIADARNQKRVRDVVRKSLEFELATTHDVNNPFDYARQLVRMGDGQIRTAFFFPHETEAAPWWQGENARLASLAAAARMAEPFFAADPPFANALETYAHDQLHWILGRNPYDTCMLMGSGHGNAAYMFFRSWKYTNAPGAIINGITAAANDENGISFNEGFAVTGKDDDWRWTEQWLPHAAWYLYAVSLPHPRLALR
ncbi:MAG TPA: glycoside hydrolase family 9 protein [Acidobacteriaceae bacterium]|nr:glycoside hydrolase family 9 protein [Acidobacteriaceae bacterium]